MDSNPIRALDRGTYYFFQRLRTFGGSDLDPLMSAGDWLGGWLFLAVVACGVGLLLVYRKDYRGCLVYLVLLGAALLVDFGVGRLIHKPRPQDAELWLHVGRPYSFPCTPALLSSFLFMLLAVLLGHLVSSGKGRLAIYITAGAAILFVGFSQLYLGLYYLSDLLAGWSAGILLALLADLAGFRRDRAMGGLHAGVRQG